jgi:hypothetical protein
MPLKKVTNEQPAAQGKARSLPKPTAQQRLVHSLGNSLSAARLRLDVLRRDPTCMWAQKDNLEALAKILDEAIVEAEQLESLTPGVSPS